MDRARAEHLPRSVRALLALGAAALAGAAVACQPATPTPPATTTAATTTTRAAPPAATGDEFNASTLDAGRWRALSGTYGNAGGGSRHCLRPQNVLVSGGTLKIISSKATVVCSGGQAMAYTSGFISSRDAGRYYPTEGTFSIRARVPAAQGIWPAFWLRHRDGAKVAEVDVLESFHAQAPGRATQALHLDGETNTASRSSWFESPSAAPGWHTFAVRIERTAADGSRNRNDVRFTFSIDGNTTSTYLDIDPVWLSASPPASTWDIAINTAIDGRWVGDPDGTLGYLDQLGRCSIGGTYPGCSTAGIRRVDWSRPVAFEVDWVRHTPLVGGT